VQQAGHPPAQQQRACSTLNRSTRRARPPLLQFRAARHSCRRFYYAAARAERHCALPVRFRFSFSACFPPWSRAAAPPGGSPSRARRRRKGKAGDSAGTKGSKQEGEFAAYGQARGPCIPFTPSRPDRAPECLSSQYHARRGTLPQRGKGALLRQAEKREHRAVLREEENKTGRTVYGFESSPRHSRERHSPSFQQAPPGARRMVQITAGSPAVLRHRSTQHVQQQQRTNELPARPPGKASCSARTNARYSDAIVAPPPPFRDDAIRRRQRSTRRPEQVGRFHTLARATATMSSLPRHS